MKKITYALFFLLILSFASNAQVTVLNEGFESSSLPAGWSTLDNDNDGNNWYLSSIAHSGTRGISSESFSNTTWDVLTPDNWLISPAISIDGATTLTFYVKASPDYFEEHYAVYIDPTGTGSNTTNFVNVLEETMTVGGQWLAKTVNLTGYTGTVRIAFRHFQCTGLDILSLDDIQVTTTPTSATITSDVAAIDFGITSLSEQVVRPIVITGSNLTGNITASTSAPFGVSLDGTNFNSSVSSNNNPATFYVRFNANSVGEHNGTLTISSPGATSISIPLHSTTNNCSTETLPFTENFEGSISGLNCWTIQDNSSNPAILSNDFATEGSQSFRFSSYSYANDYNAYLITPALPNNVAKLITFDYRGGNSGSETFCLGYSTTSRDLNDFVWSNDITWHSGNGWISLFDASMPANAKYFAIHYKSDYQYYLYIDNLAITEIPACPGPREVTLSNVSGSSAALNWTANPLSDGNETYYVRYAVLGSNSWNTLNTTNTGIIIPNLQERTNYVAKLYAVCPNGISDTTTLSFETNCLVGGDVTIGSASTTTNKFPCYTNYNYSLTQQLYLASEIGVERNLTSVSFQMYSTESIDRNLSIYLIPTTLSTLNDWAATNAAQLVYSGTVHFLPNGAWTTINFNTPFAYDGTSNLILMVDDNSNSYSYRQFNAESISGKSRYAYSDDYNPNPNSISSFSGSSANGSERSYVIFGGECGTLTSECLVPTLVVNDYTQSSANISWVENGNATAWHIEYGPAGFAHGQGTTQNVNTTSYTIQGLMASTTYDVYVRSMCSADNQSDWAYATFTTLEETVETCPQPTNFQATVNDLTATLSWNQQAGTATSWTLSYKKVSDNTWTNIPVTTNPYTITGLTTVTEYEAYLVANCSNGLTSDPTATIHFTTTNVGVNDYLANNTKLFPNPATNTITIQNNNVVMNTVAVYDVYGKLLNTISVNSNSVEINVANLADGMYFARIMTDNGMITKSFIKK